jgi:transposase
MGAIIELTDPEWAQIEVFFLPRDANGVPNKRGTPPRYSRRSMVEAILFLARTGCQWRYLPDRYPPWEAVWQQWRRWRSNGAWAEAMRKIARLIRARAKRKNVEPTMVMIDAQTVRGGRAGPTFHKAGGRGGRTIGAKRSILIEYLGLPLAVRVDPAKPHDVKVGRELLAAGLNDLPLVRDVIADRGYRGLAALAARRHLGLHIKAPPKGSSGFVPLAPLYKVEHAFARLGRWRRLSRCYEGTEASARAWLEVVCLAYLLARLRVEPT